MENQSQRCKEDKEKKIFGQPRSLTKKQIKKILNQQSKSLCQITTKEVKSTGFLCRIPEPVLITAGYVLDESKIKPGEEIRIYFTDEEDRKHYKTIKIDESRTTYTISKLNGANIDTTIIELRPDEDDLNDQEFMEIDDKLMSGNVRNEYSCQDVYLIHYKGGEEVAMSTGVINEV